MGEISAFSSPVLSIEQHDAVATVWLDRPEARNAMGPELWTDLPRAMAAVGEDADLRAVVMAAPGPHLSGGLGLQGMGGLLTGRRESGGGAGGSAGAPPPSPSMAARARKSRSEVLRLQSSI